jgi:hypothetical protein
MPLLRRLPLLLAATLSAAAAAAWAAPAATDTAAVALFLDTAGPVCQRQPAAACIDDGWRFTDTNGDDRIDEQELRGRYRDLSAWYAAEQASLDADSQAMLALGLWMTSIVGIEDLVASYDTDGDGRLTRAEALADVTLDERPLGKVLVDPDAVDREAFAARLGAAAPFLKGLFGASEAGE